MYLCEAASKRDAEVKMISNFNEEFIAKIHGKKDRIDQCLLRRAVMLHRFSHEIKRILWINQENIFLPNLIQNTQLMNNFKEKNKTE